MNKAQTVTGKTFYYDGNLNLGLTVHTCDKSGYIKATGFFIPPGTVNIIKQNIPVHGDIAMGACRDNPAKGSLGFILYNQKKSPQTLSYVIPLLAQQKSCRYYKKGKAFYIFR